MKQKEPVPVFLKLPEAYWCLSQKFAAKATEFNPPIYYGRPA